MKAEFEKDLARLINRHSIEHYADMPDFLLARLICGVIESIGPTVKKTLDWHGGSPIELPHPTQGEPQ